MSGEVFDYVVVGAGSAGCALAARLCERRGPRVALVEAGGPDSDPDLEVPFLAPTFWRSRFDWAFTTTAQPGMADRELALPRGRVLGGSSSINFQIWAPGHSHDYLPWVEAAGPGWSWEAVEPHYRRVERWAGDPREGATYGTSGPLWISPPRDPDPSTAAFVRGCAELGLAPVPGGLGGPDNTGVVVTPLSQREGARWSSADGYLRAASHRPGLRLFPSRRVDRVLIDGGRATGVRLATGEVLAARREVLLCAGAIGSPHLLLLSGVGDPDALRRVGVRPRVALPGVGRNLQDHLLLEVAMRATGPVRLADADTPATRRRWRRERLGPLTSNSGEALAFLRVAEGPGAPDVELLWAPVAFGPEGPRTGLTIGVVPLQPLSVGSITLACADPAAAPLIDPAYLSDDRDLGVMVAGVRAAERLFATEALRPLVDGPLAPWPGVVDDDLLAKAIRELAHTVHHPVGTCRMGLPGDPAAVVDPELRVLGVEGLRVADASVIPRIPRGHTHATAVVIGERAAEFVLGGAAR